MIIAEGEGKDLFLNRLVEIQRRSQRVNRRVNLRVNLREKGRGLKVEGGVEIRVQQTADQRLHSNYLQNLGDHGLVYLACEATRRVRRAPVGQPEFGVVMDVDYQVGQLRPKLGVVVHRVCLD